MSRELGPESADASSGGFANWEDYREREKDAVELAALHAPHRSGQTSGNGPGF
jgi:hypothetical protein